MSIFTLRTRIILQLLFMSLIANHVSKGTTWKTKLELSSAVQAILIVKLVKLFWYKMKKNISKHSTFWKWSFIQTLSFLLNLLKTALWLSKHHLSNIIFLFRFRVFNKMAWRGTMQFKILISPRWWIKF